MKYISVGNKLSPSLNFIFTCYEDDYFYSEKIDIKLGDIYIGGFDGGFDDVCFRIDGFEIFEEYRGNGYGSKAFKELIDFAKANNVLFIRGECPGIRVDFYKRLGAIFECRTKDDETYINNVFYFDLGNKDDIARLIKEIDEDLEYFIESRKWEN